MTRFHDHFSDMWGSQAAAARNVVDAAVAAWNRVITNFNYQSIDSRTGQTRTQFDLNVVVDPTGTVASNILGYAQANGPADAFGIPIGTTITLNRGTPLANGPYGG